MTSFERCIKLLDECIEMQAKIKTSLKLQKEGLENEIAVAEAERIINRRKE